MMRCALLLPALCLFIASTRPDTEEQFIKAQDAQNGLYVFAVNLQDSLSTYDFSFYFRADQSFAGSRQYSIPMDISWINPSSGTALKERVYAGGKGNEGMRLKYRSGVRISETGEWKIQVYPREVPDRFRGLGLIVERNGTR